MQAVLTGTLIPFAGTALGAMLVLFVRNTVSSVTERILTALSAGIMLAASIWSLLIPSLESCEGYGVFAIVPCLIGFWAGIGFLLLLDESIPHLHKDSSVPEGPGSSLSKTMMMVLAVTIHNIPEGMAVGVVFAGVLHNEPAMSMAAAFALSIGIALQNFPEGAIVSLPLKANGISRKKSCFYGVGSGAVEPVAAWITIFASNIMVPLMPYLLSFASGAMIYVIVEEMIPEMAEGKHLNSIPIAFAFGFTLMMVLDVLLK